MNVTSQKLPDEPIVVMTILGSSAESGDPEQGGRQLYSILDRVSEPVFLILDVSKAEIDLDEILHGASSAYRGSNPIFRHPNIRQILQVSDNPAFEMAARGLNSESFGSVKVELFHTLKEALEYARTAL